MGIDTETAHDPRVGIDCDDALWGPRPGDTYRFRFGDDEVTLLCFDPRINQWRIGNGARDTISESVLRESFYPVRRADGSGDEHPLYPFIVWLAASAGEYLSPRQQGVAVEVVMSRLDGAREALYAEIAKDGRVLYRCAAMMMGAIVEFARRSQEDGEHE